jgi:hypothetical protein
MKRKALLWITIVVALSLSLSACSTGDVEPSASVSAEDHALITEALSELLPSDYEDALSARNQLALGTLRMEGTAHAVTPEQARTLALLWQGLRSLSALSTTAGEEIAALQQEILTTLRADQLDAIRRLRLTAADLNAFYAERGIPLPAANPDNPEAAPRSQRGRDMTEEERAAWRAEREAAGETFGGGGGGGGGTGAARRDALIDAVITLLIERAE